MSRTQFYMILIDLGCQIIIEFIYFFKLKPCQIDAGQPFCNNTGQISGNKDINDFGWRRWGSSPPGLRILSLSLSSGRKVTRGERRNAVKKATSFCLQRLRAGTLLTRTNLICTVSEGGLNYTYTKDIEVEIMWDFDARNLIRKCLGQEYKNTSNIISSYIFRSFIFIFPYPPAPHWIKRDGDR